MFLVEILYLLDALLTVICVYLFCAMILAFGEINSLTVNLHEFTSEGLFICELMFFRHFCSDRSWSSGVGDIISFSFEKHVLTASSILKLR